MNIAIVKFLLYHFIKIIRAFKFSHSGSEKFGPKPRSDKFFKVHTVVFEKAGNSNRCCRHNTKPRYRFLVDIVFKSEIYPDSGSDRRLAWLDTVRRLYRRAMKSDRNELMIAWAKANL